MNTIVFFTFTILLFCFYCIGYAQVHSSERNNNLTVEIFPKAYMSKGYGVFVGVEEGRSRYNFGVTGFEYPRSFTTNLGTKARTNGLSFMWDYINPKLNGLYVGSITEFSAVTVRSSNDDEEMEFYGQALFGGRVGYRLMLGSKRGDLANIFNKQRKPESGFFLNLYIAYFFNPTANHINKSDAINQFSLHTILPSFHWGWRF